jgi:ABC-2 type transport system ATP-binding protein
LTSPTITVRQLSKWFGSVVALSDVSFDIGPGVTALLGPNGAGKSTLFRVLCGLANPSQGTVRIFDENPRANPELTRRMGIAPQQERLFERQTILEFVRIAAVLHRIPQPGEAALRAIETVELDPSDPRPLSAYSKGMRQRVKLAQALVNSWSSTSRSKGSIPANVFVRSSCFAVSATRGRR